MRERDKKTYLLVLTGLFAALITLFTAYIVHIPVGINGGYVHFGDAIIYLAAAILPTPYAIAAAAIGGGLADLLTAPMWAPATVIIKALIVLPFTFRKKTVLCKRNIAATVVSFLISATGYYIAEALLFGTSAAIITAFSGSLVQSGGSAVFFLLIGTAFDKAGVKDKLTGLKSRTSIHDSLGEYDG